jgi:hypothetical protein
VLIPRLPLLASLGVTADDGSTEDPHSGPLDRPRSTTGDHPVAAMRAAASQTVATESFSQRPPPLAIPLPESRRIQQPCGPRSPTKGADRLPPGVPRTRPAHTGASRCDVGAPAPSSRTEKRKSKRLYASSCSPSDGSSSPPSDTSSCTPLGGCDYAVPRGRTHRCSKSSTSAAISKSLS